MRSFLWLVANSGSCRIRSSRSLNVPACAGALLGWQAWHAISLQEMFPHPEGRHNATIVRWPSQSFRCLLSTNSRCRGGSRQHLPGLDSKNGRRVPQARGHSRRKTLAQPSHVPAGLIPGKRRGRHFLTAPGVTRVFPARWWTWSHLGKDDHTARVRNPLSVLMTGGRDRRT